MSQHKIFKFSQVSKKPSPCPTSPITFHLVIKCDSVSVLSSAVPRQQKHSVASLMSAYKSKYLLPPVLCRENQLGLSHIWWNSGWCYYRGEVIWRKVRLKTQGRSKMLCISRGAESRECWICTAVQWISIRAVPGNLSVPPSQQHQWELRDTLGYPTGI